MRKVTLLIVALTLALFPLNLYDLRSKPQGVTIEGEWEIIGPDGGDMHFVYITKNQVLFASHGFGGVWRSTDLGEHWELIYNPEWIDLNFQSMSEADGVLFAGGNHGIWKSEDDGKTWTRVITGNKDLDSSPSKYEVVSIIALSRTHIYFSVRINKGALLKRFKVVKHGFFELKDGELKFYKLPESASVYVVVMLAYDQDFNGRNLMFVSSSESGLYTYDFSTGKWEKILNKKTTRVSLDYENDYVYVGTIGDWYYRGKLVGGKWNWEHITVPGKTCPVAGFIAPDPYNPERLWFGTETGIRGSLYRIGSKESRVLTFVGVGFWKNGKWYDLRVNPGWAPVVAIVKHKEGEDKSNYIIETKYGIGARIAFVPRAGRGNIQKTEDGGKTWKRSYNGIYADTINKITLIETGLRKGDIVVTCVSGTQVTKDLGESWEEGIDFTIGDIGYGLPGYAWGAVSPSEKLEGKYDLLVATGYPPSYFTGNGVYAVNTEALKMGLKKDALKRIVKGPCYDLVIVGDTLYVGRMDSGVSVVNLKTYSVSELSGIPPDEAGMNVKYYDGMLIVFTIKGGNKDIDSYFFADSRTTGGIYVFVNNTCRTIYKGKRVINVALHGDEMVALTVDGKIVHFTNFVKDWEVKLPSAIYSDMAVDWNNRVVFLSTFDEDTPGVLYGDLDNLKTTGLKPLEGILTRRVRCLLLVDNYLFAGTEGHSVWRFKITKVVKHVITYTLTLVSSKMSANVGDVVMLSGKISPSTSGVVKIFLSINGSDFKEIGSTILSNDRYTFKYTPQAPGTYVFKAKCFSFQDEFLAESNEVTLTISRKPTEEKIKPKILISVDKKKVKVREPVTITGTILPSIPKIDVIIVINGPKGTFTHSITATNGKFSFSFKPTDKGTWTIYARIKGTTKVGSATSNVITLNVEERKCIIATVAFGSEISPEVNFLRHFRDHYILSTFTGRSFYTVFDTFYYSWSPYVALAIRDSELARAVVRLLIYPLIGILKLTALLSLPLFNFNSEVASLFAGFIASTLIGAMYFTPVIYVIMEITKRSRTNIRKLALMLLMIAVFSLGLTNVGVILLNETLTAFSTSIYVLTLILFSAFMTQAFLRGIKDSIKFRKIAN